MNGPPDDAAVVMSQGWGVLHLFGDTSSATDAHALKRAVAACEAADHSVVCVAMLGHRAQVGFMALGPDLWTLRRFQRDVIAAGIALSDSYVSMTELSEYAQGLPEQMRNDRLYPKLPPAGKRAMCFYPMSKRRDEGANWYALPFDERKELMLGHGKKGREYAGKVLQLISGSTGLDDWEWAVTLFAADPADLKRIVYEMRFDPASAVYGEFGRFLTGLVLDIDTLCDELGL
jgi:chlorite dismutase